MASYNLDYIISAVDKFTPAISRINNEIKETQSKLHTFTSSMNKWGQGVESFGKGLTKYVTAPIISAGAAALYESGKFEGYARTLRYVTGSAKAGNEMLEQLFQFEGRTPFDVGSLVAATKRLHDIGYSAGSAVKMMKKLGDVAAGSGADMEQLAFTYGRVAMRGTMTSRELMQFMRMGIPVAEIAKGMGMSTQKLAYLAQHNQISAEQMQRAFEKLSAKGGIFHGAMNEKMGTFATSVFKAKDALEQMAGKLGDILKVALPIVPALHRFTATIGRLTDYMSDFAKHNPALTKLIIWAAVFAAMLGPIITVLGGIAVGIAAVVAALPALSVAMATIGTLFTVTLAPVEATAVAILAVSAAVATLVDHWNELKSVASFSGLKDLGQYLIGAQPEYLGPPGREHISNAAAVQQFNNRSSFNGRLEIVAPRGSVKKVTSAMQGPGSFDLGLNMSTAAGY